MSKSSEKEIIRDAGDDAKAKAIEKMKKAQSKAKNKDFESIKEQADIKKASTGKSKKKKSKGKIKSKEAVRDEEGVIMLRQVKVYSPFQVYFDNPAYSVTAVNGTGEFDILPGHKNFLSLLLPGEVIVRTKRDEEKLKIDRGIMHVHDDDVIVFLDV